MSMTIWQPRLPRIGEVPIYKAIADALERDIDAGILDEGSRLPTHRQLASRLGVTTLTITRAYGEASRRGLIESAVGRGTFVRRRQLESEAGPVDFSRNVIHGSEDLELPRTLPSALARLVRSAQYQSPAAGSPRHRAAGAAWVERFGLAVPPERILVMPGGQHALHSIIATLIEPGQVLLCEPLTYPGFRAVTSLMRVPLATVALDEEGVEPRSFDKACRSTGAKVLYCAPNFQNPTGRMMSEGRRKEIAQVARKHNVIVIEDDVYGFLIERGHPPLSSLLPEQSCYLASVSKSTSPSLRVGFIAAAERLVSRLEATLAATAAFASTVSAEVFAALVESGEADRLILRKRELVRERQRIARKIFGKALGSTHPYSPHAWLELGEENDSQELAHQCEARNISVLPGSAFAVQRQDAPNAIRIALGGSESTASVDAGLRLIASLAADTRFTPALV